jgi:exonuclease VII small subunit
MKENDGKKIRNCSLKNLESCRKFLVAIVNKLNQGLIDRETARALVYCVNSVISTLQLQRQTQLESAVAELEAALKAMEADDDPNTDD